jgi:archaemetzincin
VLSRRRLLAGLLTTAWPGAPLRAAEPWRVVIAPLLPAPAEADLRAIEAAIAACFAVELSRLQPEPLPEAAFYPPRKRHRAERLLVWLRARAGPAPARIIGVTAADISTTKGDILDWGILGLGDLGGPACVVSRHRCAMTAKSAREARVRLAKVAVHELGHTFGSDHCATAGCLMSDARGSVKTVDREEDFCTATRALFLARGVPVIESPVLPW